MNLTIFLIILSNVLSVVSVFPYLVSIVKGQAKPRIVTWVVWSALTAISCAASIFEKQYVTAIFLLVTTLLTSSVAIVGWKYGDKKVEKLDIACLVGAILGIVVWQLSNSPSLAVIFILVIDLMGGIPTLVHSWKKPEEEEWRAFAISIVSSFCTLLALSNWQITAFAFPLYLFVMSSTYTIIIISRRSFLKNKETLEPSVS